MDERPHYEDVVKFRADLRAAPAAAPPAAPAAVPAVAPPFQPYPAELTPAPFAAWRPSVDIGQHSSAAPPNAPPNASPVFIPKRMSLSLTATHPSGRRASVAVGGAVLKQPTPLLDSPTRVSLICASLGILCFFPLGLLAMVETFQSQAALQRGDLKDALRSGRWAKALGIVAIVVGVVVVGVVVNELSKDWRMEVKHLSS